MSSIGDALDDAAAGERRHEDLVVVLDLGRAGGHGSIAGSRSASPTDDRDGTRDSDGTRPQSGSSARRRA